MMDNLTERKNVGLATKCTPYSATTRPIAYINTLAFSQIVHYSQQKLHVSLILGFFLEVDNIKGYALPTVASSCSEKNNNKSWNFLEKRYRGFACLVL